MAANAARRSSGPVIRSISPSSRFNRHCSAQCPPTHSSSFASATTSAFSTAPSFQRTVFPSLSNYTSPSISFSVNRPGSPNRYISFATRPDKSRSSTAAPPKRTCMCSPTNHPGSFRCSLHKGVPSNNRSSNNAETSSCGNSSRLNMWRSAMKNSLVRIGTVEGEFIKRALAALIRPSSHQQRRRGEFRPRPSRLSVVSNV